MKFYIALVKGNDMKILSEHDTLEEAMKAGEIANRTIKERGIISCINANINEKGEIVGQYRFYNAW